MKIGDWVKIKIGLYKGCTARVVDIDPGVLVVFGSGYRLRFTQAEVEVIQQ